MILALTVAGGMSGLLMRFDLYKLFELETAPWPAAPDLLCDLLWSWVTEETPNLCA